MKDSKQTFINIMSALSLIVIIWILPFMVHRLYILLINSYYTYVPWRLWYLDLVFVLLTVFVFYKYYRPFKENFLIFNNKMIIFMNIAWHIALFCLTETVVYNFVIAFVAARYGAYRIEALHLKKNAAVEEANDLAKGHMLAMMIPSGMYVFIAITTTNVVAVVNYYTGITNTFLLGMIAALLASLACLGAILLFRVIYLNMINKLINQ